jgi:hypothetical protein
MTLESMMRHTSVLLVLVLLPALATANVTVNRQPPTVEHKTFDPAHPPAEMPHLQPGEAAMTVSMFRCQTRATYEVVSRKPSDAGSKAVIDVTGVAFTLTLQIVIWLPEGASEKLKAHEEGHRKIAEKIYAERATQAARTAAKPIDGHRLAGQGADPRAAVNNAINPALTAAGDNYMKLTADISDQINNTYDQITEHGLAPIQEDEAIHQAFDRYEHGHPTTRESAKARIQN